MDIKAPIDAPDKKEDFVKKMKELFPSATPEDLEKAWSTHSSKNLTERIVDTMNLYGEQLVKDMQKQFAELLAAKMKEQEAAMIAGITKGLGLDKDQPVYLKDVEGIVRKMVLEKESGKKTETADEEEEEDKGENTASKRGGFDFQKQLDEDMKRGLIK